MPFTCDVIRKELTLCKHSLWALTVLPMVMEPIFSIYTFKIIIQMVLLKSISLQLETGKSDLILTCTHAGKSVWVCWELGEEMQLRIGMQKCQLYYKYLFRFNLSLWVKIFISMNLDFNINRVLLKEKKRTRPMLI
jgi:hypothetical protein